jgi:hypothetical protein
VLKQAGHVSAQTPHRHRRLPGKQTDMMESPPSRIYKRETAFDNEKERLFMQYTRHGCAPKETGINSNAQNRALIPIY